MEKKKADMKREHRKRVCEKLASLKKVLAARKTLLVVMQDFPDPDAIAAAAALRDIAKAFHDITTTLVCGGFVGRAENRALLKYMGLNIKSLDSVNVESFAAVALVDTQPGAGNNGLGHDIVPDIVIDHHPVRTQTRKVTFSDVRRRYGATSTILYEYLICAELPFSVPLSTALLYGIRSDTADLGREACRADIDAFLALYPLANKRMLGRIAMARVPRAYFRTIALGLRNAHSSGNCVYTLLGRVENPDIVSEIADLLLRDEETQWAMCAGAYGDQLLLSVRTSDVQANAGQIMHRLVGKRGSGGGHNVMAGGQIPLHGEQSPARIHALAEQVVKRYIRAVGRAGQDPESIVGLPDEEDATEIWR